RTPNPLRAAFRSAPRAHSGIGSEVAAERAADPEISARRESWGDSIISCIFLPLSIYTPMGYFKGIAPHELRRQYQGQGQPPESHRWASARDRPDDRRRPLLHRRSDAAPGGEIGAGEGRERGAEGSRSNMRGRGDRFRRRGRAAPEVQRADRTYGTPAEMNRRSPA